MFPGLEHHNVSMFESLVSNQPGTTFPKFTLAVRVLLSPQCVAMRSQFVGAFVFRLGARFTALEGDEAFVTLAHVEERSTRNGRHFVVLAPES